MSEDILSSSVLLWSVSASASSKRTTLMDFLLAFFSDATLADLRMLRAGVAWKFIGVMGEGWNSENLMINCWIGNS